MKHLTKLFSSPADAIAEAKRSPKMGDAISALAIAAVLGAVAAVLGLMQLGTAGPSAVINEFLLVSAAAAFLLVLAGGLFVAYLLKLTANTLGGRGNWLHGIIAVSYSLPAPLLGILAAAVLLRIPLAGALIAFVVLSITLVLGAAAFYRGTKEMFGMDMITAFVAVSVLFGTLIMSFVIGSMLFGIGLGGLAGLPLAGIPQGL